LANGNRITREQRRDGLDVGQTLNEAATSALAAAMAAAMAAATATATGHGGGGRTPRTRFPESRAREIGEIAIRPTLV